MSFYSDRVFPPTFLSKSVKLDSIVKQTGNSRRSNNSTAGRTVDKGRLPPLPQRTRATSVFPTARFDDDYKSKDATITDSRINPSSYSYLRQRSHSMERAMKETTPQLGSKSAYSGGNKQLQFPKTNLSNTRNLTILIRPRGGACSETVLPIEVVAIAGRARSPNRREETEMKRFEYLYSSPPLDQEIYHSDKSFSNTFLRNNKRLDEMIKRVEKY
ncbi:uncharacterized protein LOC111707230 [Eurytemora carolleeae]|uniref:uncharacterized protein LOC111707230 n=1 Tax=Eurytemora carolleeae TaxID=1294199 RepID=UPI000C778FE2|nr:uncharacterized protein LOC111707230 [Eurytemora carolleeae]|eukprot:XP_023336058.1 uncharacterized protein LOC111707230 [Eurytemora affinis]